MDCVSGDGGKTVCKCAGNTLRRQEMTSKCKAFQIWLYKFKVMEILQCPLSI